ncbi:hypothetical protein ZIOFF_075948 [Zingiber officinale]|uniref:Terpene synthase metal-binding domain-containing protein n=1 Tax=Zingiber officinale TaxID=94328 RepID=A0A8J5EMF0_ZINOF|nr:hypothetical protein ZIOFF_075948 [Zingiber officinale]
MRFQTVAEQPSQRDRVRKGSQLVRNSAAIYKSFRSNCWRNKSSSSMSSCLLRSTRRTGYESTEECHLWRRSSSGRSKGRGVPPLAKKRQWKVKGPHEKGQFEDRLHSQAQGLLSLYEASYLEKDGEELLHEAREFTTKHLKNLLEEEGALKPGLIREQVAHALELPLNWRFQRLHTKWFIGAWQRDPALLLLAKLDFNALQNIYKRELRDVSRWDVNAIDKLPEYMKLCFLAVFNTVNDAGYEVMRNKGVDIIPYLKRAWAELCKMYMREARWYGAGYTPTLDEYLDGAWISISGALVLSAAYCTGKDLTKEDLDKFSTYPSIVQPSCVLFRLHDDLGTSTDELARGDVQKAVQCCMHERKVPEAVASEHIKQVMEAKWRLLNGNRVATSSFEEYFQNVAINIPRAAQFFYGKGDGYAKSDGETQKQVMSLLIEPVQL